MKRANRTRSLEATVTAKHTADEERRIKNAAEKAALTVSEWSRLAHLEALDAPSWSQVILREVMALRRIIVAIQLDACQGHSQSQQRLQAIVDSADANKAAMASARLQNPATSVADGGKR